MTTLDTVAAEVRAAQREWAAWPLRERLRILRDARHRMAGRADEFAAAIARPAHETLTAEILPLLEACRFLERNAEKLLAPKIHRASSQPIWLRSVELEIRREPLGIVLVIGPGNYPLFLAAVQTVQALVAGNGVILKPGRGGFASLRLFTDCLLAAGLPGNVLQLLGEGAEEGQAAIASGVDKVVFTGSNASGMDVLAQAARRGTPSVMELSGHDPVFVLPGSDIGLVVRALRFGTRLNGGNTCIAPKEVYVWPGIGEILRARLQAEEIALPLIEVASEEEALARSERSGYGLGATVFGEVGDARAFAARVRAGTVVVNDMIAPTADPRLPFGGRRKSGFGTTRGAEGLLELTAVKSIAVRRSRWLPHLEPVRAGDAELFKQYIAWSHAASIPGRWRALAGLVRALRNRR